MSFKDFIDKETLLKIVDSYRKCIDLTDIFEKFPTLDTPCPTCKIHFRDMDNLDVDNFAQYVLSNIGHAQYVGISNYKCLNCGAILRERWSGVRHREFLDFEVVISEYLQCKKCLIGFNTFDAIEYGFCRCRPEITVPEVMRCALDLPTELLDIVDGYLL